MQSIRTKILSAFLVVIASLLVIVAYIVVLHFTVVAKYQTVVDNMAMEYKLITVTTNLVQAYNEYTKNPADTEKINAYATFHKDIENTIASLDTRIKSKDSIIVFTGLKNTIKNVVSECDSGVAASQKGNTAGLSSHYELAYSRNEFVRENTSKLILSELDYMQVLQKDIDQTHLASIVVGSVLVILISIMCIIYAQTLSKNLIQPLQNLDTLTKRIAEGDMAADVDEKLLKGNDEVGSLANSFNTMIKTLRENIKKIVDSNSLIAEAQKGVEAKNHELEEINKFMVNRELRMMELKKENEQLKEKLMSLGSQPTSP
jgi:methyl-accepting chemotaxis protein